MENTGMYDETALVVALDQVIDRFGMMGLDSFYDFLIDSKDKVEHAEEKAKLLRDTVNYKAVPEDYSASGGPFVSGMKELYRCITEKAEVKLMKTAVIYMPDNKTETIEKTAAAAEQIVRDFGRWYYTPSCHGEEFRKMMKKASRNEE